MTHYVSRRRNNTLIEYTAKDESFVQETASHLSEAYKVLADYFTLKDIALLRVIITPDRAEFDQCIREILKIDIEVPSNPGRIGWCQKTDLIVLSPLAWDNKLYTYTPDFYRRFLFHEMTHIVEEYLSKDIEKVTRWWSEGVAVYLSGQWMVDHDLQEKVAEGIEKRSLPSIKEMEGQEREAVIRAYTWGWTIVKYIECTYGKNMVTKIVKECGDDNIFRVMAVGQKTLEKRWREWVLQAGKSVYQQHE